MYLRIRCIYASAPQLVIRYRQVFPGSLQLKTWSGSTLWSSWDPPPTSCCFHLVASSNSGDVVWLALALDTRGELTCTRLWNYAFWHIYYLSSLLETGSFGSIVHWGCVEGVLSGADLKYEVPHMLSMRNPWYRLDTMGIVTSNQHRLICTSIHTGQSKNLGEATTDSCYRFNVFNHWSLTGRSGV